jgi:hypothetical protein
MTSPSPAQIRRAKAERTRASLLAALTVLQSDDEIVAVPAVGDMNTPTFRKHVAARHHDLRFPSIREHNLEHGENPDLDHMHKRIT